MSHAFARLRASIGLVGCVLALGAACGGPTEGSSQTSGIVARVVDGDTLVLHNGDRVRLVQIDAPESDRECHAAASTRELARLAPPGQWVVLEADPRLDSVDRFGRLLRYVHARGRNVNVELVRRGAATPWFYRGERGRYAARLLVAVAEARAARRGLWGACRVAWSPTRPVETRPR